MHILVCGSRNWTDRLTIGRALYACRRKYGDFWLIHGNCRGADQIAGDIALHDMELPVIAVPAKWGREGKAAGPKRNAYMLKNCGPDLVLAFHENYLTGSGTGDMIRRANEAGLDCLIITGPGSIEERLPDADVPHGV